MLINTAKLPRSREKIEVVRGKEKIIRDRKEKKANQFI